MISQQNITRTIQGIPIILIDWVKMKLLVFLEAAAERYGWGRELAYLKDVLTVRY